MHRGRFHTARWVQPGVRDRRSAPGWPVSLGRVQVQWEVVDDPSAYVCDVLGREAPDIPSALVVGQEWFQDGVALAVLRPNRDLLDQQDQEPEHVQRRDAFVARIRAGEAIPPLIALGFDMKLVDGYARYRALRLLGVAHGQILRQRGEDQD